MTDQLHQVGLTLLPYTSSIQMDKPTTTTRIMGIHNKQKRNKDTNTAEEICSTTTTDGNTININTTTGSRHQRNVIGNTQHAIRTGTTMGNRGDMSTPRQKGKRKNTDTIPNEHKQ